MSDDAVAAGPSEAVDPDGPVEAARAWVRAAMDDKDLVTAWPLTDPPLRKVLAQHWILSHQGEDLVGAPEGWEELAEALAASPCRHPLWDRFATERLARWRQFWPGFSAVTWGVKGHELPRPDLAVVTFVEPRGKLMSLRPGPPLELRRLALRRSGGRWLMAGLDGQTLFRPGWPPTPG